MSALGHEQTSRHVRVMSAIPLKADIHRRGLHVRLVPEADMRHVPVSAKWHRLAECDGARARLCLFCYGVQRNGRVHQWRGPLSLDPGRQHQARCSIGALLKFLSGLFANDASVKLDAAVYSFLEHTLHLVIEPGKSI